MLWHGIRETEKGEKRFDFHDSFDLSLKEVRKNLSWNFSLTGLLYKYWVFVGRSLPSTSVEEDLDFVDRFFLDTDCFQSSIGWNRPRVTLHPSPLSKETKGEQIKMNSKKNSWREIGQNEQTIKITNERTICVSVWKIDEMAFPNATIRCFLVWMRSLHIITIRLENARSQMLEVFSLLLLGLWFRPASKQSSTALWSIYNRNSSIIIVFQYHEVILNLFELKL